MVAINNREWKKENRYSYKRTPKSRDLPGDGIVLKLDCIKVNILVVMLCSSVRCHHLKKLSKEYTGSFCIISLNYMYIYDYLQTKSLIRTRKMVGGRDCLNFKAVIKG